MTGHLYDDKRDTAYSKNFGKPGGFVKIIGFGSLPPRTPPPPCGLFVPTLAFGLSAASRAGVLSPCQLSRAARPTPMPPPPPLYLHHLGPGLHAALLDFSLSCTGDQAAPRGNHRDFPGGPVVKNPPANAGGTSSSPGPGRSHMPRSS